MTDEIRHAVKTIFRPGDIIEVRSFGQCGRRVGRYPLGWDLVRAIEKEDQSGQEVFFVLNPTKLPPVCMSPGTGTTKPDVVRWRYFLLDVDPVGDALTSDSQYQAALALADEIYNFLTNEEKWPGVVVASSGNGAHVLVNLDLPNDRASEDLVGRVQKAIRKRFATPSIDVQCFADSCRLVRAYGTINKKGTQTDTVKWRRSGIICPQL